MKLRNHRNNSQYGAFWPPRGSEFVLQISWSGPLGGFWCHALGKKKGCAVCAERNFNELLPWLQWSSLIFNDLQCLILPCFPVVAQQTWFILVPKSPGFKFPWCVDVSNTGCFAPWTSCGEWNWYEPQFLCVTCKLCPGTVCYSSDVFDRATWICCFDGVIVCDCEITGVRILTLDILGYLPSWTVLGGRVEVHPLNPMSQLPLWPCAACQAQLSFNLHQQVAGGVSFKLPAVWGNPPNHGQGAEGPSKSGKEPH